MRHNFLFELESLDLTSEENHIQPTKGSSGGRGLDCEVVASVDPGMKTCTDCFSTLERTLDSLTYKLILSVTIILASGVGSLDVPRAGCRLFSPLQFLAHC